MTKDKEDRPKADDEIPELPSFEQFLIELPPYVELALPRRSESIRWVGKLEGSEYTLDAYCPWCNKEHTPFRHAPSQSFHHPFPVLGATTPEPPDPTRDRIFDISLYCQRDPEHQIVCLIVLRNAYIQKAGQYPSFADLHSSGLESYKAAFYDYTQFRELKSAIICAAHGYHVAGFAYLRRVFEHLLERAHSEARSSSEWDDTQYSDAQSVPERIRLLANYLPPFLVERKELYHILSEGVHKLSEDECARHFNLVENGIKWILHERLEQKEAARLKRETERAIQETGSELFRSNPSD